MSVLYRQLYSLCMPLLPLLIHTDKQLQILTFNIFYSFHHPQRYMSKKAFNFLFLFLVLIAELIFISFRPLQPVKISDSYKHLCVWYNFLKVETDSVKCVKMIFGLNFTTTWLSILTENIFEKDDIGLYIKTEPALDNLKNKEHIHPLNVILWWYYNRRIKQRNGGQVLFT